MAFVEKSAIFDPFFTLDFATVFFFYSARSISLASNPQPGGPGLCIYVPRGQSGAPRHQIPFLSPTTLRATVEI
jgi:hypothetical protein